jgi:DNA processing protein
MSTLATPAARLGPTPTLTAEEELHWIALRIVPGLGARRGMALLNCFRTPQAIFAASPTELESQGVSRSVARSISSGCVFDEAVTQQERMRSIGVTLIPVFDRRYPPMLSEIFDPPILLFARGNVELLQTLMLGVVGTRRPTPYGVTVAERLSEDLAKLGFTIASGMASGIDTVAHSSALKVDGNTIAVFGCGIDQIYPTTNRKLADGIMRKGLLLSEYPMGAPAYPQNFPVRNRIISGMSLGILVIEGAQYSGSAITARLAMEQGREVFAVPGNVTSKASWGPNLLIKQGAKLVQEASDVAEELTAETRRQVASQSPHSLLFNTHERTVDADGPLLSGPMAPVFRALLDALKPDSATQLDTLVESLEGVSSSEIIAGLFELELAGRVRQLPGKQFVKCL